MEQYLVHHGILGMKWGVRRYQNEDRTLTPAGKKRYKKDLAKRNVDKNKKATASTKPTMSKKEPSDEEDKIKEDAKKELLKQRKEFEYKIQKPGHMTSDEINDAVNRLRLEKQLRELRETEVDPFKTMLTSVFKEGTIDAGKKIVSSVELKAVSYLMESIGLKDLSVGIFNPKKKIVKNNDKDDE